MTKNYISPTYNHPAVILFDGSSYFGAFECDVEDIKAAYEDIEIVVVEKYPYWSDEIDQRIENLNNQI